MKSILGLMILCFFLASPCTVKADVCGVIGDINRDYKIGLQEAVYALQVVSGINPQLPVFYGSETESNNSFNDADEIEIKSTVTGSIKNIGDEDYFRLITLQPGVIVISVTDVPSNVQMLAEVFDSQQVQTASSNGSAGQSLNFDILSDAGVHYIKLSDYYNRYSSADIYTMDVSFDTSDVYENNNSFSQAKMITPGETIKGTIRSKGDEDYFYLEMSKPGVIVISVTDIPSNVQMLAEVFDSQQVQTASSSGSAGQSLNFDILSDTGVHYIKLSDYYDRYSSADIYTMDVRFDTSDVYENNNSFPQAKMIALGETIKGTIRSKGDEDYFTFEMTQSDTINVSVKFVPKNVQMRVEFFDSQQNLIDYSSGGAGEAINFSVGLTSAGTYYMKLSDYYDRYSSAESYEFRLSK